MDTYDVAVIGGGPAGATAAGELAAAGHRVLLLDRPGRIKPCGGAIPPQLLADFDIPESLLVARAHSARMVSPAQRAVDMPITGGFVGMVDREHFDEWLRDRAAGQGAERVDGIYQGASRDHDGVLRIEFVRGDRQSPSGTVEAVRARALVGADGARSAIARELVPDSGTGNYVAAYHEIVESPGLDREEFDGTRCDIHYRGELSPDFYAWVFPHGGVTSVGVGSAHRGFSLRKAVTDLRSETGLGDAQTVRREGAPIPLKPLRRWDNGRDVVLAGDAAGAVAPASGEGIYYAMCSGRMAAQAVDEFLATGDARALAKSRKAFMKAHGRVFWVLGIMQKFWYVSDNRRERFVNICRDPDVQYLTWQAYMYKRLVRARPLAHARIFFKDMAHLLGLVSSH